MILDKTSIEDLLYTDAKEFERVAEHKEDGIFIRTNTEQNFFDKSQIGNDSIDLRIADYGYIMKTNYTYINTLSNESFEEYFRKIHLDETGYILKPQQLIFVPTFERIALSGSLIGRVTGRSVFARMGLSVHCTQDKFSSGINSVAGLQIINNSPVPLKIFPKQMLAQMLIEKTGENRHPYKGRYCGEINYTLPLVNDKDRAQYDDAVRHLISLQKPRKKVVLDKKKKNMTITVCRVFISVAATVCMGVFGILQNIPAMVVSGAFEVMALLSFTMVEFSWMIDNLEEGDDES